MTLTKTSRTLHPSGDSHRTNEEKAIPDKTTTAKVESEKVVADECLSPTGVSRKKKRWTRRPQRRR